MHFAAVRVQTNGFLSPPSKTQQKASKFLPSDAANSAATLWPQKIRRRRSTTKSIPEPAAYLLGSSGGGGCQSFEPGSVSPILRHPTTHSQNRSADCRLQRPSVVVYTSTLHTTDSGQERREGIPMEKALTKIGSFTISRKAKQELSAIGGDISVSITCLLFAFLFDWFVETVGSWIISGLVLCLVNLCWTTEINQCRSWFPCSLACFLEMLFSVTI